MKAESRQREKFRLVIDTNIWISGSLSRSGTPGQLIRLVLEIGRPIFSSETFSELETRLLRPKFDRYISSEHRQKIILMHLRYPNYAYRLKCLSILEMKY